MHYLRAYLNLEYLGLPLNEYIYALDIESAAPVVRPMGDPGNGARQILLPKESLDVQRRSSSHPRC